MRVTEKVKNYLDKIEKENGRIKAILHLNQHALEDARAIDEKVEKTGKKGRLYGFVFGIKSNINVKGLITNCASKTLENYRAPYDSTVIEKIKAEDGVIIGMTNMDEFAAGGSGNIVLLDVLKILLHWEEFLVEAVLGVLLLLLLVFVTLH